MQALMFMNEDELFNLCLSVKAATTDYINKVLK
jgi:hypothetical protein